MKKFSTILILFVVMVGFQNCTEQKFSSNEGSVGAPPIYEEGTDNVTGVITQTGGPNCRNQLQSLTTPIKLVFIVDTSTSNATSDPTRVVRGDSIERVFNTYKAKANFGWSISTFTGTSANVILQMGNASAMGNALATFRALADGPSGTPYEPGLNAARDNILADAPNRAPQTKYAVIFISDGKPSPQVTQNFLTSKVQEIVGTAPGAVSFNTVYYGPQSTSASERLRLMAQAGGGNFLDTNSNPTGSLFLISDLIVVPGVICDP